MITYQEAAARAVNEQATIRQILERAIFARNKNFPLPDKMDEMSATLTTAAALFYAADRLEAIEEALKTLDMTIFEKPIEIDREPPTA